MYRQKDITREDEPLRFGTWSGCNRKSRGQLLIAPEKMKQLAKEEMMTEVRMCLVVKVKYGAIKNNIA